MSPNTALFAPPPFRSLAKPSSSNSNAPNSSTRAVTSSSSTKMKKAAAASRATPTTSTTEPLPEECEALKQKIRQVHPEKSTRFSLSAMKRVAIPPVEIPEAFSNAPTLVAGKRVLFTKSSWMRRKHELRLMRRIRENEVLR